MGEVIDLQGYRRARRQRHSDPMTRLEDAVERVEQLLSPRDAARAATRVERELTAITKAVTDHRVDSAIERAERLADRLEHPAAGAGR